MKECHILGGGQNILWPLLHFFFMGVRTPNPRFYARSSVVSRVQQLSVAEWVSEWVSEWVIDSYYCDVVSPEARVKVQERRVNHLVEESCLANARGEFQVVCILCPAVISLSVSLSVSVPVCLCLYCHVLLSLCLRLVSSPATANYKSTSSKSESKSKSLIAVCTDNKINTLLMEEEQASPRVNSAVNIK